MCFLLHHGYGYKLWDYEIIVSFLLHPLFLHSTNSWGQGVMQQIWFEMGCNADQVRRVFPLLHLTWCARREKQCVIMYHGFVTSEKCNVGRKWRMKLVCAKTPWTRLWVDRFTCIVFQLQVKRRRQCTWLIQVAIKVQEKPGKALDHSPTGEIMNLVYNIAIAPADK